VTGSPTRPGRPFDARRYVDAAPALDAADRRRLFEDNARVVYGRLSGQLKNQQ
jgi:4-oxalmesaconate hydratase